MMNDTKPTLKVTLEDNITSCPNLEDNWTPVESENVRCYVSNDINDYEDAIYDDLFKEYWKYTVYNSTISNYEVVEDTTNLLTASNSTLSINRATNRDECVTFINNTNDDITLKLVIDSGEVFATNNLQKGMRRIPPDYEFESEYTFTISSGKEVFLLSDEASTLSYYLTPNLLQRERVYPPLSYDVILQSNENGECLFKPYWGYPYYIEFKSIVEKVEMGRLYDMSNYLTNENNYSILNENDTFYDSTSSWTATSNCSITLEEWVLQGYIAKRGSPYSNSFENNYVYFTNTYDYPIKLTFASFSEEVESTPIVEDSVWYKISKTMPTREDGVTGDLVGDSDVTVELNVGENIYLFQDYNDMSFTCEFSVELPRMIVGSDKIRLNGLIGEENSNVYYTLPFTEEDDYSLSFNMSLAPHPNGYPPLRFHCSVFIGNPNNEDYKNYKEIRIFFMGATRLYDYPSGNYELFDTPYDLRKVTISKIGSVMTITLGTVYKSTLNIENYKCEDGDENRIGFGTNGKFVIYNMELLEL